MVTEKRKQQLEEAMKRFKEKNPNYFKIYRKKYRIKEKQITERFKKRNPNYFKNYGQIHREELREKRNQDKDRKAREKFKKENPDYWNDYLKNYQKKRGVITLVIKSTNNRYEKNNYCGLCNSSENLQFHHFRYRLPVQRKDFTTLCHPCHTLIHLEKSKIKSGGN